MRIGIDIDGVMNNIDEVARPLVQKQFNVEHNIYEYALFPGMTQEEISLFEEKNKLFLINEVKPLKDVQNVIHKLSNDKHIIFIITARSSEKSFDSTMAWLKLNNFNLSDFDYFCFDSHDKSKICLDNQMDVMIEDCPKHLIDLNSNNINTLKFDHLYNQNIVSTWHSDNWNDIYKIISEVNTFGSRIKS